jgi:LPXTG-motif cell wall-anchored protein
MKGSLKIVKTSSDGKVEGFSFRITGANGFDVTLKTDENGEILIEGLRIGEYTVSEVVDEVSSQYSRPDDKKATVMTDSTTIVEMHNVFIDNPKTGDDSNIGLWLGLLCASVLGIGATVFFGFKRKKKEDNE